MLVGEVYLPVERLVTYYGDGCGGVHMPFNFQLITTPWNAQSVCNAVLAYEEALPSYGWPNWVLGNHDNPRIASRIGRAQARVAAMLLLTLRGTPTMYYGDEIGMHDVPIPPDRVQDPFEKNVPGMGLGRDPERTPMQWDPGPNAGFSTVEPWLPLADDYGENNVAVQRESAHSMLALYRRLIELRRAEPALSVGTYTPLPSDGDVMAYLRTDDTGRRLLIVMNFGPNPQTFTPPEAMSGRLLLSTRLDRDGAAMTSLIPLRLDEGMIFALD